MREFERRALTPFQHARLQYLKDHYPVEAERMYLEGTLIAYLKDQERAWHKYEANLRDPWSPNGIGMSLGMTPELQHEDNARWWQLLEQSAEIAREIAFKECVEAPI